MAITTPPTLIKSMLKSDRAIMFDELLPIPSSMGAKYVPLAELLMTQWSMTPGNCLDAVYGLNTASNT